LVLWRLKNTLLPPWTIRIYRIPVLAEICFEAKPIKASPIVRELGFDPVSHGRYKPSARAMS